MRRGGLPAVPGEPRLDFRKFLRKDGAASPVVGVVMMVGTTVILSAAVYGWTSAYANLPNQGVRVLALASEGPGEGRDKAFSVSAVMPGISYGDLNFTLGAGATSRWRPGRGAPRQGPASTSRAAATGRSGREKRSWPATGFASTRVAARRSAWWTRTRGSSCSRRGWSRRPFELRA